MELFNPFFFFLLSEWQRSPPFTVCFFWLLFLYLAPSPAPPCLCALHRVRSRQWPPPPSPPPPSHLLSPLTPSPSRLLHTNKDDVTSSWLALRHELLTLWGCSHPPASPRTPPCRQVQQVSGFASRVTVCRSVFTLREILQSLGETEETVRVVYDLVSFSERALWNKSNEEREEGGMEVAKEAYREV